MRITVTQVAHQLKKSPQYIRLMLQQDKLPFGCAIKVGQRWNYTIYPEKFREYVGEIERA